MDGESQGAAAFAARCLLRAAKWGTLATGAEGQPFASLVTQSVAPDGAVLMLLSSMAEHGRQLAAAPRCAVMVAGAPENLNWQTAPRVTVTGEAAVVEDAGLRAYWLARHPYASLYADFADFSLWRVAPRQAMFVAGFGGPLRLSAAAMAPPPEAAASVAAASADLLGHCNGRHREALSKLAHKAGAGGQWRLLGVDPDGFDLVQDETVLRLAFDAPVASGDDVLAAMRRLVEAARHYW